MAFRPPSPAQARQAIGPTQGLPQIWRRALEPDPDFEPLPVPRPGDWLAEHPEPGQTFEDFTRAGPPRPEPGRNRIYLQPLGRFPQGHSPPLERLQEYARAYFASDVQVLPPLPVRSSRLTTRLNPLVY